MEILKYPNKILSQETVKVPPEQIKSKESKHLIENMIKIMTENNGIGLAANQVGVPKRLLVADISPQIPESDLIVLANPEIIATEGEVTIEEGCLSVPDYQAEVKRHAKVTVRGLDLHGQEVEIEAEGLLAVVLQHEIDHLNGILFIDHISRLKRELYKRKLRKQLAKQES